LLLFISQIIALISRILSSRREQTMDQKHYESLIKKFRLNDKDTGSTPVQIINLTKRILELTEHLKVQKKDVPAKRTLLKIVATRKTYLKYLKTQKLEKYTYEEFIKALNLKK